MQQNKLYLVIGALVVVVVGFGIYILRQETKPQGVELRIDQFRHLGSAEVRIGPLAAKVAVVVIPTGEVQVVAEKTYSVFGRHSRVNDFDGHPGRPVPELFLQPCRVLDGHAGFPLRGTPLRQQWPEFGRP